MSKFYASPDEILKAEKNTTDERVILLCAGGGCIASGALELKKILKDELEKLNIGIGIKETGCMGPCAAGPVLKIMPDAVVYEGVSEEDAPLLIHAHFVENILYEKCLHHNRSDGLSAPRESEQDFYKGQEKVVLHNCGRIDPGKIEEYIASGGYTSLAAILKDKSYEDVIEIMKDSGLRGRGGAGFPTWLKWSFTAKAEGEQKYVLCNADEGDPGAFMDRSLLEGDPHSVIEGMIIAAYTVGANQGYVYCRAEYPLAVSRLQKAIEQARESNLLGESILGTNFCFDIEIRMGSGAFVCGEETALINSIEGKRGEPRPRPPFPANKGLWGQPTLLNNVETYANVPRIFSLGIEKYTSLGTEDSRGTKVFALAGAVNNTGLVEVPVGTSLGELIFDIGGGIKNNKEFKAAQIGGPSGGCIPRQHLSVSLDYESVTRLGAIMGSGGLIVMDDETCMVDVARFFLEFVQEESCGKCVPCRVGTKRMLEIVTRICEGEGQDGDIEALLALGEQIKQTSLCGLGQTAPNPVLSTIRYFRDEYEEHIRDKRCTAGVCPELVRAPCQSACPADVDIPGFVSLVREKRYAEALLLHRERNPFAAVCARVCFHTCEDHCRRSTIDEPVSVRGIKRFLVAQEVTIQTPEIRENAENEKRKIAIVGAGPSGLSCAYFLARLGYKPRVFESQMRPGGMLVQTIPSYRLPRETLAREVRMIERMGVTIETGMRLGLDFTLASLKKEGYEAVFLGIGAEKNLAMGIPGEDAEGVAQAMNFLREYNIRGSVPVGNTVVIVGGGNAAIDAARTAVRLGAESVTVVYRRTREQMPAYAEEVDAALEEGVILKPLMQPVEIVTGESGAVSGIRCLQMKLGDFDRSGRRRPEKSGESGELLPADQVIISIGQRLDRSWMGENAPELDDRGFIMHTTATGQTSLPWIFTGGDAAIGPSSVVQSIGAGERAAVGIDIYLTGENHAFWRDEHENTTSYNPDEDPVPYSREKIPMLDVARRKANFDEVEQCWSESSAVRQSSRCLRCDYGKHSKSHNVVRKEDVRA